MESTGVYWIALHQKLEAAGIEVYLVNARHVRCVPGRKTDVQDSQWLRQLHRFGLLNASFRPEDIICRLRSLHRHRDNLVSSSGSEIQHMQKALQQVVGLNVLSVLLIVSEIGIDMSKWRSAKAFCSWLGLCPGNKICGGQVRYRRTC